MTILRALVLSAATTLAFVPGKRVAANGEPQRPTTNWSEPPYFGAFTVASGNTYTLLQAGTVMGTDGKLSLFAVFYASYTHDPDKVLAAAKDLFEATRLLAEKQGQSRMAIVAYFDLEPGQELSSADSFGVLYEQNQTGDWSRSPLKGTVPPAGPKWAARRAPGRDEKAEAAARASAVAWLARMDKSLDGEAWATASPQFRSRVASVDFEKMAATIRASKGRVTERTPLSALARTWVKGYPDGSYVAFDYVSRFSSAGQVVERISMVLDKDGAWRVIGYSLY